MSLPDISMRDKRPRAVSILCFVVVTLTSPFNLILGLMCWSLLRISFGAYFADNNGGTLFLLLALTQTGLFAILWLPTYMFTRRLSATTRCVLVLVLTFLYLGFWLGWTAWLYAEMARTDTWL